MTRSNARLMSGGELIAVALLLAVRSSFVFSGTAEMYAWYIARQTRHWLIIAGCSATAAVVLVPLLWRGNRWQVCAAVALLALTVMMLLVCAIVVQPNV